VTERLDPTDRPKKERLDVLLVDLGLAPTRAKAQALVIAGQVVVDDQRVDKPGTRVSTEAEVRLKGDPMPYVSRGGLKLAAALEHFKLDVRGAICADIGASTGGFTDCLLQAGAAKVYALDVGRGQLHARLRSDPRVVLREGVNARHLGPSELPEKVSVLVLDVSFISLTQVLPATVQFLVPGGVTVALVKPQFEAGREQVGKGGVVRDDTVRAEAVSRVRECIEQLGLLPVGALDSPVHGPAGNREILLVARRP
jgi:23S rRNA (cytidine1920-2'-O)/16S rRNA (cytidine1409-2'-O)-methyltransferase